MNLFGTDNHETKRFPPGVGSALFVIIALLLWELVALVAGASFIVPSPADVAVRAVELLTTASFWVSVAWSLVRVLIGFAAGTLLGMVLAVLMAASPCLRSVFAPFIKIVRTVPVVCFILLMLLWVNSTWLSAIISALMVLPVVWTSTIGALDNMEPWIVEVAQSYRLSKAKRLFKIYLPAIAPQLLSTAAVALGLAWKSGITAEVLALPFAGMGTDIYHAKLALEASDIFVWAIVIALLSLAMEALLKRAARVAGERGAR